MVTYEDCLGFCELTADQIAAIARHEHLPEMLALELGAHLCATPKGRRAIRRMILEDIDEARRRGRAAEAAELQRALQGFAEAFPEQTPPAGMTLEQRVRALGCDAEAAPWVARRVETYLATMARRFGVEIRELEERDRLELLAAETRCAACAETARCRRFLAGAAPEDAPEAFCPNAGLLAELRREG